MGHWPGMAARPHLDDQSQAETENMSQWRQDLTFWLQLKKTCCNRQLIQILLVSFVIGIKSQKTRSVVGRERESQGEEA